MIAIMSAIPAVILMIPVAFVQLPTLAIVIVMGMTPICPFIGRTVPAPCHPPIVAPTRSPVPIDPGVAGTWKCPTPLVTNRRRCAPHVHPNLGRSRNRENGCEQYAIDPIQLHFVFSELRNAEEAVKGFSRIWATYYSEPYLIALGQVCSIWLRLTAVHGLGSARIMSRAQMPAKLTSCLP